MTHLEGVLLVAQTLLLLLPQLVQAVIMPVIIHELVVSLRASLADLLTDIVQLLAWLYDTGIDELELRGECFWPSRQLTIPLRKSVTLTSHLLHEPLIGRNIPERDLRIRMLRC